MNFPLRLFKKLRLAKGPAFLGDVIIATDAVYLGTHEARRVNTNDFRIAWTKRHKYFGPGLVFDDVLLLGNGVDSVIALNLESGETVWTQSSVGSLAWRGKLLSFLSDAAVTLDPSSGGIVDRFALPERTAVHDLKGDLLLYDTTDGDSVLYNLREQRIVWQRQLAKEIENAHGIAGRAMSLVAGQKAIVATKGGNAMIGCSLEDGGILWHLRAHVPYDLCRIVDGKVYALTQGLIPTTSDLARFMRLDELTGEKAYETEHKQFLAYRPTPGAVFDGHIAFGNEGGFVFVFRLSDGQLVWSHRARGQPWQPSVLENRLYVTTDDGYLLVFDTEG